MDRCGTIVMGRRCTRKEDHKGECKFKDFTPPSERKAINSRAIKLAQSSRSNSKIEEKQ